MESAIEPRAAAEYVVSHVLPRSDPVCVDTSTEDSTEATAWRNVLLNERLRYMVVPATDLLLTLVIFFADILLYTSTTAREF